jgi:hypothetical protein
MDHCYCTVEQMNNVVNHAISRATVDFKNELKDEINKLNMGLNTVNVSSIEIIEYVEIN